MPIWLTEAAVFYVMGFPFGIDDAHSGPGQMAVTMILVTAITNIGSSIPAAPGGLGLFELIARETLVLGPLASVDRSVAAGFAVVVHAAILLPMIVLGQLFLWANHISLRRLSRAGRRDEVASPQQVETGNINVQSYMSTSQQPPSPPNGEGREEGD